MAVSLVSVPIALHYLGSDRYGLWLAITSALALVGFADLGIGAGLLNAVAVAHGGDDRERMHEVVTSAIVLLTGIAVTLGLLFAIVFPFVSWASLFNVSTPRAASEAGPAVAVFATCFLVGIPLAVVDRVQSGLQEGFVSAIWVAVGALLGLAGLFVGRALGVSLPVLLALVVGAAPAASLLNGVVLFAVRKRWLRPSLRRVSWPAMKILLRSGLLFLVLQMAVAVAYDSDLLIVAQIRGSHVVPQLAVPMKLFSIAPLLLGFVLMALWPAYGEARVRGDMAWIHSTLRRSMILGLLITVPLSLFLVLFGTPLAHAWVGSAVTPSPALLVGLGIWIVMNAIGGPIAVLLNGLNVLGFQAVCGVIMAIVNAILSILLVQRIGVPGAIYGSIIAQAVCVIGPTWFYARRTLAGLASS